MLNTLQLSPNWLPLFWTVHYATDFRGRIPRTSRSLETGTRKKRADLIRERTGAALSAAAARGRKGGRKAVITAEKLARAKMLIKKGLMVREAAARIKVGKTALCEAIKSDSSQGSQG